MRWPLAANERDIAKAKALWGADVMVRWAALLLALTLTAIPPSASAGAIIRFAPGPMDGSKIITPWGTYIAVFHSGYVWIGTEQEYQDAIVQAISSELGFRQFCRNGQRRCTEYVEADLPRLFVGNTQLASITVQTLYDVDADVAAHRPKVKRGAEFVEIVWVQSRAQPVRPAILDRTTGASFAPHDCGVDGGFAHCDFIVPRVALTHPVAVAFASNRSAPAVLAGKSIAWLAYDTISQHIRSMAGAGLAVSPSDPDDDSYANLNRLHDLDPDIPASPRAAK